MLGSQRSSRPQRASGSATADYIGQRMTPCEAQPEPTFNIRLSSWVDGRLEATSLQAVDRWQVQAAQSFQLCLDSVSVTVHQQVCWRRCSCAPVCVGRACLTCS